MTLVAHCERMAGAEVYPCEHAEPLEQIKGTVYSGAANAVRTQLVDQCLGCKRAWLVGDRVHHKLAAASQAQAFCVPTPQHPVCTRKIRAPRRSPRSRGP